jgi:hypothetical protein
MVLGIKGPSQEGHNFNIEYNEEIFPPKIQIFKYNCGLFELSMHAHFTI